MEYQVVIVADDFGLTDGVCCGIVEAMEHGTVTATSALPCFKGSIERLKHWGAALGYRVGVHLQLTQGTPCLPPAVVPSLVDDSDVFPAGAVPREGARTEEVLAEWRAQVLRIESLGFEITHLDAHHHAFAHPPATSAYVALAAERAVPARAISENLRRALRNQHVPCADACVITWVGAQCTAHGLLKAMREATARVPRGGTVEIMSHPGYVDDALAQSSSYVADRRSELDALRDPRLMAWFHQSNAVLARPECLLSRPPRRKPTGV